MHLSLFFGGLALALIVDAAPASSNNKTLATKAHIICDSHLTNVDGPGTGKTNRDVWKESDMDSFLPVFDKFLLGNKPPFGEYSGTIPETVNDMRIGFSNWECTFNPDGCSKDRFPSVAACKRQGKGGLNAQWYQVSLALYHFKIFMEGLIQNIREVARDKIITSIGSMQDILHPVHLSTENAGFSIITSAVLGALGAVLEKVPGAAMVFGITGSAFGGFTGAMTQVGNENDANIVKQIKVENQAREAVRKGFDHILDKFEAIATNVLEKKPKNSKEDPYSSQDDSVVKLFKGGIFADATSSNITKETADSVLHMATTAIISVHWPGLVIGKRSKDFFGKKACDVKQGDLDGLPEEFRTYCRDGTAYIFANHTTSSSPREKWHDVADGFEGFADEKNKDTFNGVNPWTIIDDSQKSQELYGWNKQWNPNEDTMKVLLEKSKNREQISMFTYPVVDLDKADSDPPAEITKNFHIKGYSNRVKNWKQNDRVRFMFIQAAIHEKDSKGNPFPWNIWTAPKGGTKERFPYDSSGWD